MRSGEDYWVNQDLLGETGITITTGLSKIKRRSTLSRRRVCSFHMRTLLIYKMTLPSGGTLQVEMPSFFSTFASSSTAAYIMNVTSFSIE